MRYPKEALVFETILDDKPGEIVELACVNQDDMPRYIDAFTHGCPLIDHECDGVAFHWTELRPLTAAAKKFHAWLQ